MHNNSFIKTFLPKANLMLRQVSILTTLNIQGKLYQRKSTRTKRNPIYRDLSDTIFRMDSGKHYLIDALKEELIMLLFKQILNKKVEEKHMDVVHTNLDQVLLKTFKQLVTLRDKNQKLLKGY